MTAITSTVEQFLSISVVDGVVQPFTTGERNVAILAKDISLSGASKQYTSTNGISTDSDIDTATRAILTRLFSQTTPPLAVWVIKWDDAGGDDPSDALDAAVAAGVRPPWDYMQIVMADESDADVVDLSTWVQAQRCIYMAQSADADWLTGGGVPSGFTGIVTHGQTFMTYEDTTTDYAAAAWAGRVAGLFGRAGEAGSIQRPSSTPSLTGPAEYGTLLTATQRGEANTNGANWHQVTTPQANARNIVGGDGSDTNGILTQALDGTTWGRVWTPLYTEVSLLRTLGTAVSARITAGYDMPAGAAGIAWAKGLVENELATLIAGGWLERTETYPRGHELTYAYVGTQLQIGGVIAYRGVTGSISISLVTVSS